MDESTRPTTWTETRLAIATVAHFPDLTERLLWIADECPGAWPLLCAVLEEWRDAEPGRLLPDLSRVVWPDFLRDLRTRHEDPNYRTT